jgi:hypothetical protein
LIPSEPVQHEFKLRGNPFSGDGDESTMCRQLIVDIVVNLSTLHWRFHGNVNVRGGADALYFVFDENHSRSPSDLVRLSIILTP